MIILGIDPGIARLGYGIIKKEKGKISLLTYGCLETLKDLKEETRLTSLFERLAKIISKYKPEAISLEKIFFSQNAKTALVVGQARGIILLAGGQSKIEVFSYTPLEVKLAICGYGRAEKKQIQKMVQSALRMKELPRPDDAADGLALAITHCYSKNYDRKS